MNGKLACAWICVAITVGCGSLASLGGSEEAVPTVRVVREIFVREVGAEGNLKPVDATHLVTPSDVRGRLKIAWLAPDGQLVSEGDLVVRGATARAPPRSSS
mgnify:CR=1 FL=1